MSLRWAQRIGSHGKSQILKIYHVEYLVGLEERQSQQNRKSYIYGDPAYAPSYGITGPYRASRTHALTPEEQATNIKMSSYRIVVEWGFANVLNQFSSAEWKRNQKTGLSPAAINYMISALLYNCQTCLRGRNQISDRSRHAPSGGFEGGIKFLLGVFDCQLDR